MNVYETITARIIEQLEKGTAPWQKPWSFAGDAGMPHNIISRKPYRGINHLLLNCAGFSHPGFLTYKQAKELGGNVRKGEHGLPVVFWKFGKEQKQLPAVREIGRGK